MNCCKHAVIRRGGLDIYGISRVLSASLKILFSVKFVMKSVMKIQNLKLYLKITRLGVKISILFSGNLVNVLVSLFSGIK